MAENPSGRASLPTRIGSYVILDYLGGGGMGDVYRGLQETPVRREAAIKQIRPGKDDRQHRARFEMELKALERMDHPNIAKVYDTGFSEGGQPWFAMELINGVSLKEYCNKKRLTLEARLELFQQVCDAVQHVHQKGLIHRDIKPTNVMVAEVDDRPIAKLIDFGLARAVDIQALRTTLFDELQRIIGTVAYMSPEQASPRDPDLDTRSDVYSLGVMLYELLTGDVPLHDDLSRCNVDQLAHRICEVEPKKPSTHLSELGDALANAAALLQLDGRSLCRKVAGDLDWIVMKALEKDRNRRYATARDLAREIARHLRNEPVEAGPPGVGYRLRKWVRRYRVGVLAGSVVAVSLLMTAVVTVVMQQEAIAANAKYLRMLLAGDTLGVLQRRAEELWPALPTKVAAMDQWLRDAEEVVAQLPEYVARAGSEAAEGEIADPGTLESRRRVADGLTALSGPEGLVAKIRERRHDAATITARSVDDPEPKRLWAEAVARVAANPAYAFTLAPQVGLWPLGPDPQSKLEEFAVMQSGKVPDRRDGRLILEEQGAIVLVLVPGGEVLVGATRKDSSSPNYDPQALDGSDNDDGREAPLLGVGLDPFFIGKYELTQAQWMRLGAPNPSNFRCGAANAAIYVNKPDKPTGLNPVENVSCNDLTTFLKHVGLDLPTEAQWETACRARGRGAWNVGKAADLDRVANLADPARPRGGYWIAIGESAGLQAYGRLDTAPMGSYAPNGFGLHDMHGNVNEWCRDPYVTKRRRLRPGSGEVEPDGPVEPWNAAIRGGSFRGGPGSARTAFRQPWPRSSFYPITGARVSRAVLQ